MCQMGTITVAIAQEVWEMNEVLYLEELKVASGRNIAHTQTLKVDSILLGKKKSENILKNGF